ncbi:hypothetical protein [Cupriavidus sp. TMH.W2]|uniref:hypothetical protein n=1 Tax=Cupriavidus sp. TMH.W2 TaxID=3434465 RepID=UPI003D78B29D
MAKLSGAPGGCVDHWTSGAMDGRIALTGWPGSEFFEGNAAVHGYWHQLFATEWHMSGRNSRLSGSKHHQPMLVVGRESGFDVFEFRSDSEHLKQSEAGQD